MSSSFDDNGPEVTSTGFAGTLAMRMRELRNLLGFTQADFAERLCVSRKTLSEIENGKKEPGGLLLHGLEFCFGVDRGWILSGKGMMLKHCTKDSDELPQVLELIRGFNSLTTEGREKLLRILEIFVQSEKSDAKGFS